MLEEVLRYAARGWKCFPLHTIVDGNCTCGKLHCGDAGKHPRTRRGVKEATGDQAQLTTWFYSGAPPSNIGLATGAVSNLTVLDVDVGPGKLGAETWAALTREKGEPATLMAQTGSGGLHVLFLYNGALKTSSNTLGPGIDCRNDNGYIVAPPSLHRSGKRYEWLNDEPLAALPAHLAQRKENRGRPRMEDRSTYSEAEVATMLEFIEPDDRDLWRNVGIILGRAFSRSATAWEMYVAWSAKWKGKPGRNHDEIMQEAFHVLSQLNVESRLTLGSIVHLAVQGGWQPKTGEVPLDNFIFFGPGNNFIYRPTASFWIAQAVDAAVSLVNDNGKLLKPSTWLKQHALTTSMTKDPGIEGDYAKGVDCRDGIIIKQPGAALFNSYRGPTIEPGDARLAGPFLEHVNKVFPRPGDADQFLDYMAHRVQRPQEKPRFALLIAGQQGVGKDTAFEFCCPAIGAWNVANIEPSDLESSFNEFASAVVVRISEAANLHEMNKWAFNERMKVLIAGSPDYLNINPKYGQKYSIRLHCGVVLTTNHIIGGIYIPSDDRRYDVIECATKEEMGIADEAASKAYFTDLWDWFNHDDGAAHVAAFLNERQLNGFSAASGQRKTQAHSSVIATNLSSDHWLLDIIEAFGEPPAVRADAILSAAVKESNLNPRELAGKLNQAMARAGYIVYRNPGRKDGRWKFADGKLSSVYVRPHLSVEEAEAHRVNLKVLF